MTGWLMLVLWIKLSTGQPTLETRVFKSEADCQIVAGQKATTLQLDGDLFLITAGCFGKVPAQEVKL
jgi:hypothetical protein